MPIAIRAAGFDDVPAILALEQRSPRGAHWTSHQYANLLNNGVVLMAEEEGKLSGFICAKPTVGEWEIENIVVAAEYFRRGIADALLRELVRHTKSDSASVIVLEVRESNLPARKLYEKNEFREVGRRRAYYHDPVEDAILYTLRVDQ